MVNPVFIGDIVVYFAEQNKQHWVHIVYMFDYYNLYSKYKLQIPDLLWNFYFLLLYLIYKIS